MKHRASRTDVYSKSHFEIPHTPLTYGGQAWPSVEIASIVVNVTGQINGTGASISLICVILLHVCPAAL